MTRPDKEHFYARAAQLGHSRDELEHRGQVATKVTVNNIDELRRLMRPADPKHCEHRQLVIDQRTAGQRWSLNDHVEAFIYGTKDLPAQHRALCASSFPLSVTCVSVNDTRTLPPGETVVGPSSSPVVWNYDTLNIPDGSWITVKNNIFTLKVTNLVMQYVPPPASR